MPISLLCIKTFRTENLIEILLQQNFKTYILDDLVTAKDTLKTVAQEQCKIRPLLQETTFYYIQITFLGYFIANVKTQAKQFPLIEKSKA